MKQKTETINKTESITPQTKEKLLTIETKAIKKVINLNKVLNESFTFNVKLNDSDSLSINDKLTTSESRKVNNIKIVFDSKKAQTDIKNTFGLDFGEMIKQTESQKNGEIKAFMKVSLCSALKKIAKQNL